MTSRSESFHGTVSEDGKRAELELPAEFRAFMATFAGKSFTLTFGRRKKPRTSAQHRWWKRTVRLLGEEVGYDRDELPLFELQLLTECFGTRHDATFKRDVPNVMHLSDTDTVECSEAIDWLPRFAAKTFGIPVRLPNE